MKPSVAVRHVLPFALLAAVLVSAVLVAGAGAASTPPPITDTFNRGDNGWEIYEGSSEYDAEWIEHGGNPGGFIRNTDPDRGTTAAVFADEHYVSHIARYIGNSSIVFDLRTNRRADRLPRVTITDPDKPGFPALRSKVRRTPTDTWRHYAVPLDPKRTRWIDRSGKRVGSKRFARILDRDPVFTVRADYSTAANEKTDFDNVGLINFVPRTLTLRYRPHTGKLKGVLKTTSDPRRPVCEDAQKVELFKKKSGDDQRIGRTQTNSKGHYTLVRKHLKTGKYYAFSAQNDADPGSRCLDATSKTVKVKRR